MSIAAGFDAAAGMDRAALEADPRPPALASSARAALRAPSRDEDDPGTPVGGSRGG
jgi:hypothetical protein